jgi:cholesterol oxidase
VGAGVLRILPQDFAKQLTTFRGAGKGPVKAVAGFGSFFVKSLRDLYLKPTPQPDRSDS